MNAKAVATKTEPTVEGTRKEATLSATTTVTHTIDLHTAVGRIIEQTCRVKEEEAANESSTIDMLRDIRKEFPSAEDAVRAIAEDCAKRITAWKRSPEANVPTLTEESRQALFYSRIYNGVQYIRQVIERHPDFAAKDGGVVVFKFNKPKHAAVAAGTAETEVMEVKSKPRRISAASTSGKVTAPATEKEVVKEMPGDLQEATNAMIAKFGLFPVLGNMLARAGMKPAQAGYLCNGFDRLMKAGKEATFDAVIAETKAFIVEEHSRHQEARAKAKASKSSGTRATQPRAA